MAYLDGYLNIGGLPYILNIGGHVGPYAENHPDDLALIQVLVGVAYGGANAPHMDPKAKNKIDAAHTWPSTFDWVLEEALIHCGKYVCSGYTRHGSLSPATKDKPGIVAALNVMAYNRNRQIWEAIAHEVRNGGKVTKKKHSKAHKSSGHHGKSGHGSQRIHVF